MTHYIRVLYAAIYGIMAGTTTYQAPTTHLYDTTNSSLVFPKDFLWGAGTSAAQVEEDSGNHTWSPSSPFAAQLQKIYQKKFDKLWLSQKNDWIKNFCTNNGRQPSDAEIESYRKAHYTFVFPGKACESYTRYKEDIQALEQIGCNAYRFSVPWERIMPTPDTFDQNAINHYKAMINELTQKGITPCITLYHYTEPIWFAEKGGFEKSENIPYFVAFAEKLFHELGDKVYLYFTFNAPVGGIALNSYQQGSRPPFKKDNKITGEVIKNILDAHVAVYEVKQKVNSSLKVGILKNIHQLDPWRSWSPIDLIVCKIGNDMQDDPFYQFFTTGKIDIALSPVPIHHENKNAPHFLDFVGLNYYGHRCMSVTSLVFDSKEERSGTPGNYHEHYTVYPEGMYRALKSLDQKLIKPLEHKTGKHIPIYVTENGIGTEDDNQRERFMKSYLAAISRACQEGVDVRGYFYWSLLDNYEWGRYSKKYGLFSIDPTTGNRIIKPSAQFYKNMISAYKKASTNVTKRAIEGDVMVQIHGANQIIDDGDNNTPSKRRDENPFI